MARSILYQRGIYPPDTFSAVSQYGLSMLVTTDDGLKSYLANVLRQLSGERAARRAARPRRVGPMSLVWAVVPARVAPTTAQNAHPLTCTTRGVCCVLWCKRMGV